MKKSLKFFCTFLICFSSLVSLSFISCASTSGVSKNQEEENFSSEKDAKKSSVAKKSEKKEWTLFLYDNCPETTAALTAEMALKNTVEGYSGKIEFTYDANNLENTSATFFDYLSYCEKIKASIENFSGQKTECNLSFNTAKDKTGTDLDFSNTESVYKTLKFMAESNLGELWAFYEIKEAAYTAEY